MKIFVSSAFFSFSFVFVFFLLSVDTRRLEENFVVRMGNEPEDLPRWVLIRDWLDEANGTELVKEFCQEAHRRYGLGADKVIDSVSFNRTTLKFRVPQYKPMMADVITYGIDSEGEDGKKQRKYWYIMEGYRPDCVWYLVPVEGNDNGELELKELVFYVKW